MSIRALLPCLLAAAACGQPETPGEEHPFVAVMRQVSSELGSATTALRSLDPEHRRFYVDHLTADSEGTLVALMVETHDGCVDTDLGPGCAATAHALQWSSSGWAVIESKPTSFEACDAPGVRVLDAVARPSGADIRLEP